MNPSFNIARLCLSLSFAYYHRYIVCIAPFTCISKIQVLLSLVERCSCSLHHQTIQVQLKLHKHFLALFIYLSNLTVPQPFIDSNIVILHLFIYAPTFCSPSPLPLSSSAPLTAARKQNKRPKLPPSFVSNVLFTALLNASIALFHLLSFSLCRSLTLCIQHGKTQLTTDLTAAPSVDGQRTTALVTVIECDNFEHEHEQLKHI